MYKGAIKGKPQKKRVEKLYTPWLQFQIKSETEFLTNTLIDFKYNYMAAAKYLGVQRSHLYGLCKKYGIERPKSETGETGSKFLGL